MTVFHMWLIGLVLIGLKLAGVISWSWGWVTLPIWADVAVLLLAILF